MTRTFVDSGVLIAAARGTTDVSGAALALLADANRVFVSSIFVQLEVLPKPAYFGRREELAFYEEFFAGIVEWADMTLVPDALSLAQRYGLSALDALHAAAALQLCAEELITTEQPGKPLHRVTGMRVISV